MSSANDFEMLLKAAETMHEKLRADDNTPDLQDQFNDRMENGNHRYFIESFRKNWAMLKHVSFCPLPKMLLDALQSVQCCMFMGIFPEIGRAWVSIDNTLYLWDYMHHTQHVVVYKGVKEVIVSVALVPPKKGVFVKGVQHLVVLATTVEIVLLAMTMDGLPDSASTGVVPSSAAPSTTSKVHCQLFPTQFAFPLDDVTIFKILGTPNGRILAGGNDGILWELDYSSDGLVGDVTGGKEGGDATNGKSWLGSVLETVTNFTDDEEDESYDTSAASGRKRYRHTGKGGKGKCRKFHHTNWTQHAIQVLVPPVMRQGIVGKLLSATGLGSNAQHTIVDMSFDTVRQVLYMITNTNCLSVYSLGEDGKGMVAVLMHSPFFNTCQQFLYNKRKDSYPSLVEFNSSIRPSVDGDEESSYGQLISVHIIPITESKQVHMVVVLSSGLRVYGTLRNTHGAVYYSGERSTTCALPPSSLDIVYMKAAPTADILQTVPTIPPVSYTALPKVCDEGVLPRFSATGTKQYPYNSSYYRNGVWLGGVSVNTKPSSVGGTTTGGELLVGVCEDVTGRRSSLASSYGTAVSGLSRNNPIPGLRETVDLITHTPRNGAGTKGVGGCEIGGKIYDIQENLCATDSTNAGYVIQQLSYNSKMANTRTVPLRVPAVVAPGITPASMTPLSQMVLQALPHFHRRQFMCLTNSGIHILNSSSPIDTLIQLLNSTDANNSDVLHENGKIFFQRFGVSAASAMCISVVCGAGDSEETNHPSVSDRALWLAKHCGYEPNYRVPSASTATPAHGSSVMDVRCSTSGGVVYTYSSFHDACFAVFSRTVRAVWCKPVLVVDDAPAGTKTNVLLHPLQVASAFRNARVLSAIKDMCALLSRLLEPYAATPVTPVVNPNVAISQEDVYHQEAYHREYVSLHGLLTLCNRCCEALVLIGVIHGLRDSSEVAVRQEARKAASTVNPWAGLKDVNFYSFVVTELAHSTCQSALHNLFEGVLYASDAALDVLTHTSSHLTAHCPHYYSMKDREMYEVCVVMREVKQCYESHSSHTAHRQQCVNTLMTLCTSLASQWVSVDDVTGSESVCWSMCDKCVELSVCDVRSLQLVVDMCLIAADNFRESTTLAIMPLAAPGAPAANVPTPESLHQARQQCYECLIAHLIAPTHSTELDPDAVLAQMVQLAVNTNSDPELHYLMYSHFYTAKPHLLIYLLPNSYLVDFLKARDVMLLYRNFEYHNQHVDAALCVLQCGRSDDKCRVYTRLEYFHCAMRSVVCAQGDVRVTNTAEELAALAGEVGDWICVCEMQCGIHSALHADLTAVEQVLEEQRRAGSGISEGAKREVQKLTAVVNSLLEDVKTISELYAEAAEPYKLWDYCLRILHLSRSEELDIVVSLWNSIIYRLIPLESMTTNDNEDAVQRYLHSMRSRSLMLNDRRTQVRSCTSFCTSEGMEEWLVPLAQFIKSLSLNLSSDVAGGSSNTVSTHDLLNSRVIPIRVLLLELEQLNAILSANFSGASEPFNYMWVSTLLLDLGLSHQVVINLYMEVCVGGRGDINGAAGKCNVVKVITNLMLSWIRHAHSTLTQDRQSRLECCQSIRHGHVTNWLEACRSYLSTVSSSDAALQQQVSDCRQNCKKVESAVTSMMFM